MSDGPRNQEHGFKRILYDAMALSESLCVLTDCPYKDNRSPCVGEIEGKFEAHQLNAMVQIRSMDDFLSCSGQPRLDTMFVVHFFGCTKQDSALSRPPRAAANQYAAHKSWDAVTRQTAQQIKRDVIHLGKKVLENFIQFQSECKASGLCTRGDAHARKYGELLEENMKKLGIQAEQS